ncbi:MAG: SAM-dependent methyltransferase [Hyphomicrobiaceae bacterium]|nr:SAM-dependent methyltransferase [Hyphomicrobiaceae bacterium]
MPENESLNLLERIKAEIRRDGPITIARYMEICGSDPDAGYWQRGQTIGSGGDFITAPEISQIFGELIGLWCAVVWQQMGSPDPVHLIELGPGRGSLMRDMLRTMRRAAGPLHGAARVHLVEVGAPLRAAQAAMLEGLPSQAPHWHEDIGEIAEGPALIVANEFLDALPIRQLVADGDGWRERVVGLAGDGLAFAAGAAAVPPGAPEGRPSAAAGDILELRQGEDALLGRLARREAPFAALIIDYGPAEGETGDTLQAMRRHAWVDPLEEPGAADLTAHVRFAGLARKAQALGLAVDGPITQAEFLGALGLAPRASRLMAANPAEAAAIELAAQRLVAPTGMGSLFKVLCVRTPSLPPAPPWG